MNGRAYDYNLGRFLSVDPFIQEPGNSQSMNPYSYIMNNPLAGTDPSGYKFVSESFNCQEINCGAMLSGMGAIELETNNGQERVQTVTGTRQEVDQKAEELLGQGFIRETGRSNENGTVTETFVKPVSGGTSLRDYLGDVKGFWEKIPIGSGYENNEDVNKAAAGVNSGSSKGEEEVEGTDSMRQFVNDIAKVTFEAQVDINYSSSIETEFFMQVAEDKLGNMRIVDAARVPQGGEFNVHPQASFIIHWHYVGLHNTPSGGDHSSATLGLPSFVVTPKNQVFPSSKRSDKRECCNIYEVGRKRRKNSNNGAKFDYIRRKINGGTLGPWIKDERWN